MKFIEYFTERPITTFMVYAVFILLGFFSFYRMPVDLMPGGGSGVLTVFVGIRGGLPPEDIETLVTKPVEEEMASLPGLESIVSVSRKERAVITLNYKVGTDTSRASLEVQERLAKIRGKLPKEIEKPVVSRYDEGQAPVIILAMSSKNYTPEQLREIADNQLKPVIKRAEGVANIEIGGGREKKILVEFDQSRLEAYSLPIRQVIGQIGLENVNILTGKVEEGKGSYLMRTVGAFKTLEELGNLPIAVTKEGSRIRLKDVAEIRDFYMEAESYSRLNREPVVSIYIQKETLANTITTAKEIKKIVENFKKTLDPKINLSLVGDESVAVDKALGNLTGSIFQGALIDGTILLLFFKDFISAGYVFLGSRVALIITLAIMNLCGLSLNVMSICGLAMASGQVVDNSIIVLGNIHQYKRKLLNFMNRVDRGGISKRIIPSLYQPFLKEIKGKLVIDSKLANKTLTNHGTSEMILVLLSNTFTSVAVFIPIIFMNPQIRMLYAGLSITATAALLVSLVIAITMVPSLSTNIPEKWVKHSSFFSTYVSLFLSNLFKKINSFLGWADFMSKKCLNKVYEKFFSNKLAKKQLLKKTYEILALIFLSYWIFCRHFFPSFSSLTIVRVLSAVLLSLSVFTFLTYRSLPEEDIVSTFYNRKGLVKVQAGYRRYRRIVAWIMKKRYWVASFLLFLLVSAGVVYKFLDKEFMGSTEQNEFIIFAELPSGTKLDISDKVVSEIEKIIGEIPEVQKSVKTSIARVEGWSSKIYVTLLPASERTRSPQDVIKAIRAKISKIGQEYDAFIYFSEPVSSKEFVIDVFGYDYNQLRDVAIKISQSLEKVSGLADIKLRYKPGRPEVKIEVDREKASLFDFTIHDIAESLHAQIRGLRATYFITPTAQIETIARLSEQYRKTLEDVQNLTLVNPLGTIIPIRQFANFTFGLTPSEIWRKNRERMIQVSANRGDISLSKVAENALSAIHGIKVPTGYYYEIGGDFPKMIETERQTIFAFFLMVFLNYAILAGVFESYLQPLVILIAVPLTLIGAVPLLYFSKTPVTIGTLIGFITLGGMSVNNSTMLMDVFNKLHEEENKSILRSLLQSGQERIRPILATTFSTLSGMIPLALEKEESGSLWAPMAITIIGGLSVSTILVLFVLPAFYLILEDIKSIFSGESLSLDLLGRVRKKVTKMLHKV